MGAAFNSHLNLAAAALELIGPAEWDADHLLAGLKSVAESQGLKLGDVMQPVRVALTGSTVSEPVNELLAVVDRATALGRLRDMARRFGPGGGPEALPA
jgi:glutamyl-tRNA synthetase